MWHVLINVAVEWQSSLGRFRCNSPGDFYRWTVMYRYSTTTHSEERVKEVKFFNRAKYGHVASDLDDRQQGCKSGEYSKSRCVLAI